MISFLDGQMSFVIGMYSLIFELFEVQWIMVAVSESVSINCIFYQLIKC